jgi:predicted methyltransferase
MNTKYQFEDPEIQLVGHDNGEITLYVAGEQAMQAWERDLMWKSADILCQYGSEFLEVGLGLGFSALRIANHPNIRKHIVVEKYQKVIDLFKSTHPSLPTSLEIVHADFVDYIDSLPASSLDGIFFDPALPRPMWNDQELWDYVMPKIVRALRIGGAFVPFFSTKPILCTRYVPFFERVEVERYPYTAYPITNYVRNLTGYAFIQSFIKTR